MLDLLQSLIKAFKEWRKRRVYKRLELPEKFVSEYQFERLKEDVDEVLKLIGYKRNGNMFGFYLGADRFEKIKKPKRK